MQTQTLEEYLSGLGLFSREKTPAKSIDEIIVSSFVDTSNMKLLEMQAKFNKPGVDYEIKREDFIIHMGSQKEKEIIDKIIEYYSQFGYDIQRKGSSDINVDMKDKGTAAVTITAFSDKTMAITVNIWNF